MKKNRKKLILTLIVILIALFVWPVFIPPVKPSDLSGVVIEMERAALSKYGPQYSIVIRGDGTVEYNGRYSWVHGQRTGRISQVNLRKLVDEFYKSGYWWNWPVYWEPATGKPYTYTSIRIGLSNKGIINYQGAPQRLNDLEDKIDEFSGALLWSKGIDTSLLPLPPPVDYDHAVITYEQTGDMSLSNAVYKLTIHGDGTVVYEGEENVHVTGTQVSHVPREDVKRLVDAFYAMNFLALTEKQVSEECEMGSEITSLSIDGKYNDVNDFCRRSSDLGELYNLINSVVNSDQWIRP